MLSWSRRSSGAGPGVDLPPCPCSAEGTVGVTDSVGDGTGRRGLLVLLDPCWNSPGSTGGSVVPKRSTVSHSHHEVRLPFTQQ